MKVKGHSLPIPAALRHFNAAFTLRGFGQNQHDAHSWKANNLNNNANNKKIFTNSRDNSDRDSYEVEIIKNES